MGLPKIEFIFYVVDIERILSQRKMCLLSKIQTTITDFSLFFWFKRQTTSIT